MLSWLDLCVCLGYFATVLLVGFWAAGQQRNSVDAYFRADNRLPWYAIGFSIVAAGISSEQFVGEAGYAYKLGMPVVNWEWLVLPALSILLWIFLPLYVRNDISTMPEYLERRFGPRTRTLYALLSVASYVLVNFALVFYTGGFAIERMWKIDRVWAVWILAGVTGAYTIYGGLTAVAWTSSLQCVLLLAGGLYVFVAGMARIDWDFAAVLGVGQRAHLFTPSDHEVPWTALLILMFSTNVWYYATNQYINQRCLAARNEWHARMGVLFSAFLQLLIPLATCFPGLIYRVLNPHLDNPDAAYPLVVAAVVPEGLRGLVVAAILSAIMSTVSGLVNSTSTLVTLDLVQRGWGRDWPEEQLVRVGRWSGGIALLIGAALAPLVMRWENIFRYAQDLWAPMAAPIVVVFLAGALWPPANERGARACLWLAICSVPFTLGKAMLSDLGIHFLPSQLENPMVFAGAYGLISLVSLLVLAGNYRTITTVALIVSGTSAILVTAAWSPSVMALLVSGVMISLMVYCLSARRTPLPHQWDQSMLACPASGPWYTRLALWWLLLAVTLLALYVYFW